MYRHQERHYLSIIFTILLSTAFWLQGNGYLGFADSSPATPPTATTHQSTDLPDVTTQQAMDLPVFLNFPKAMNETAGNTLVFDVEIADYVKGDEGLRVFIHQLIDDKRITGDEFFTLNPDTQKLQITIPNDWWKQRESKWQLSMVFEGREILSDEMTLTAMRVYQNPMQYYQINDSILLPENGGVKNYKYSKWQLNMFKVPKTMNTVTMTKEQIIENMIKSATSNIGQPYKYRSSKKGYGFDCSGLIMYSLYTVGVSPTPSNVQRHTILEKYRLESPYLFKSAKMKDIPYSQKKRGDLVFYKNAKGEIVHSAIYLGKGKVIDSLPKGGVKIRGIKSVLTNVAGVKRVFN